jgi:hypothetical protein
MEPGAASYFCTTGTYARIGCKSPEKAIALSSGERSWVTDNTDFGAVSLNPIKMRASESARI